MTDSLVEKLTPSKDVEAAERIKILETIGEVCFSQGEYHLATKKYVEAGNKTKVYNHGCSSSLIAVAL